MCAVVTRSSALAHTSVFVPVYPFSEPFLFEFCAARSDDTTQEFELKLQSQRGGRVSCGSGEELAGISRSAAVSPPSGGH